MESLWVLIATFRRQNCWSSSSDEADCLRVAICSTLVRCYWCISIFTVIPVVRWWSLVGPHWSAVVLFDRRYPSFGKFNSSISTDVLGMKSYVGNLFDPSCVSVRVTISKLSFAPIRNTPCFVSVLRNRRGLSTSKPYVSVILFYPFSHWSPCFTDINFAAFIWDLVNDTVLFCWF